MSARRLWTRLTRAIVAKDMDAATEAKTAVEDAQRETRRNLEERGDTHVPRFFHLKDGRWVPKLACVPPPSFPSFLLSLLFLPLLPLPWVL